MRSPSYSVIALTCAGMPGPGKPVPGCPLSVAHSLPSQRAIERATTPPAEWKLRPPTTRSPPNDARLDTPELTPLPDEPDSPLHAVPSQRAMLFAVTAPAWLKLPPAISAPPCTASTRTDGLPSPSRPLPSDDHALPSQRATRRAGWPPAVVKLPPTTRSLPNTRNARTLGTSDVGLLASSTPLPSAAQVLPSQRAMRCTAVSPAMRKLPPTTSSPWYSASAST